MRAAPRAANGSPSEPDAPTASRSHWPAVRRLLSPAQFAAVSSDPQAIRCGQRWLAVVGRLQPAVGEQLPARFGFTASRRHARRAVDRNTVKRVLREAARRRCPELDDAAAGRTLDIVMRLKSPVPGQRLTSHREWKAALRAEADSLLTELLRRVRESGANR